MTHLLFFCLASVGLTAILVDGSIFLPLRRHVAEEADKIRRRREKKSLPPSFTLFETAHEILRCYQCCGFWSGLFCSHYLLTSEPFGNGLLNSFFVVLFGGFAGSLLATLYLKVIEYVFSYTILAQRSTPLVPQEEISAEPEEVL